jgi:flagellar hook protein FlgE
VFLNPALSTALDRIGERAADVRLAFTPGAMPRFDDVANGAPSSTVTLDPLSTAPPDGAYFIVRGNDNEPLYTRNGSFRIERGILVDARGNPVLGARFTGAPLGELRVDPVDEALGRAAGARIESDGTLWYARTAIDPRSGQREPQRVAVGRVALARFPAGSKLRSSTGESFAAPPSVVPHTGFAGEEAFGALQPMRRERSGVDLDESLARLKAAYVAFDALAAAEAAKGKLGKTAMDLLK